jgi:chemotaxis protein MotB
MTTSEHDKIVAEMTKQHQDEMQKAKLQNDSDKVTISQQAKQLDDCTAKAAGCQKQLTELNKLLGDATADKAKLDALMQATSSQLEQLNKQKAAAEQRAATYRQLNEQLRSMIDAGKLSVRIRKGRMLIALPNELLFASGSASLKKDAQEAVAGVAKALSGLTDRQFLVAGHTDDKPIHTARFPSNWELSTARAVTVTRALIADGMRPDTLGAVGYGEFDPIAPNDNAQDRAQNRRIEVQLQPNLSELPSMEDLEKQQPAPAPK